MEGGEPISTRPLRAHCRTLVALTGAAAIVLLVESKVAVAQRLGAIVRPELDRESLEYLRTAIETFCDAIGLTAAIDKARRRLDELNKALSSLRQLSAYDRREHEAAHELIETQGLDLESAISQVRSELQAKKGAGQSVLVQE